MAHIPLQSRRRRAALILAGLLVVFVAGGVSVARLARRPASAPAPVRAERDLVPPAIPAPEAPEASAPPASGPDGIPLSALPLQLLGTFVAAEPGQSLAFLRERGEPGSAADRDPFVLREGDAVPGFPEARLAAIEPERVLIERDGRLEVLRVEALSGAARTPLRPVERSPEEIAHLRRVAARLRERIAAPPEEMPPGVVGGLLAEGDPHPIYVDGALVGIELQNVRPDDLYAELGLRDGDLVESINGVPFDAPGASGERIRQLVTSPEIELSVERIDGSRPRVTIPRDALLGRLRSLE